MRIQVTGIRPSKTVPLQEHPGAIDAAVTVDGVEGEVTLLVDHDGNLNSWGPSVDYWATQNLHHLSPETLQAIVNAVVEVA